MELEPSAQSFTQNENSSKKLLKIEIELFF